MKRMRLNWSSGPECSARRRQTVPRLSRLLKCTRPRAKIMAPCHSPSVRPRSRWRWRAPIWTTYSTVAACRLKAVSWRRQPEPGQIPKHTISRDLPTGRRSALGLLQEPSLFLMIGWTSRTRVPRNGKVSRMLGKPFAITSAVKVSTETARWWRRRSWWWWWTRRWC